MSDFPFAVAPGSHDPYVYRLFDAAGTLLYIGVTTSELIRFRHHRAVQPWWPQVARIERVHFTDTAAALAAEYQAIRTERPRHNVTHVVPPIGETFGSMVKHYRMSLGLSQKQLGEILSINNTTISRWETDVDRAHPAILPALAAALGVSEQALHNRLPEWRRPKRVAA